MALPFSKPVEYPERDGKPMAETESHVIELMELFSVLRDRYRDDPDVYVGANMLHYYVEGNPRISVSPDVFVVLGIPNKLRRIYKLWEEGRPPTVIFEITSDSTRNADLYDKKNLYARLGVQEYFLHDVLGDYLEPSLQGFRLESGRYRPIDPAEDGSLESRVLGLRLFQEQAREGFHLRPVDAATGEFLLRYGEEAQARRAAEDEIVRLRQELERARKGLD
jgi:Uma2 family endonuclease